MIWYQTLLGPLYRFPEPAVQTRREILRGGNDARLAQARQKLLDAMTYDLQSAQDIAKKIGTTDANVCKRANILADEGLIERVQVAKWRGGKKYLWRLKCAAPSVVGR